MTKPLRTTRSPCFHASFAVKMLLKAWSAEQFVKPGGFCLDLREVGDFGSERDGKLVRAVTVQTQFFGIITFECDHDVLSFGFGV